eukprot:scaffold8602_cov196-Amphora_coffeaeformis.AAC.13
MVEPNKENNATAAAVAAQQSQGPSYLWVSLKFLAAVAFFGAGLSQLSANHGGSGDSSSSSSIVELAHRRLAETGIPTYIQPLLQDLEDRRKLFSESEVIKYWFEYTGPLQVSFSFFVLHRTPPNAQTTDGKDDSGQSNA